MSAKPPENPEKRQPPPARRVRQEWSAIPQPIRAACEQWMSGRVAEASSQASGFSPGVAARLRLEDGRRFFVKAASPQPNADTPVMHRREGHIVSKLPADAPVPRLLWSYDEGESGWIVLIYEDAAGRLPAQPWRADELERVIDAMTALSAALTPSPIPAGSVITAAEAFRHNINGWRLILNDLSTFRERLDSWSRRHLGALARLEGEAPEAVEGDSLQHFDIRADNILLTPERVWFVDWPHARIGAPWIDAVLLAPSMTMQGGPPPEQLIARFPACRQADPAALTAAVAACAGFFTHRALLPAPPGLPTLRAFQNAQGIIAREWLAQRTGLE